MANFHLRGLRDELYDALRRRADANGRSVNAEILTVLEEAVQREQDREQLMRDLDRFRKRVRVAPGVKFEEIIREARDERARRP